jgi:hypothetical protein
MLYNQTYNLDQVGFAADGLKDAQQTVMPLNLSSSKFIHIHNAHVYMECFFISSFIDECNEGSKQGAQGNDENCQN